MTSHLLLIEDDEIAAYVTLRILKECAFSAVVDVVHDGFEAIEYLTCEGKYANRHPVNPALILLDLKMPDLDGFEVLKKIRSMPGLSSIPVFILSASETEEDRVRSTLLGISKYLVKPLDFSQFAAEAKRVLASTPSQIH
jgi:two-component system, response regulator